MTKTMISIPVEVRITLNEQIAVFPEPSLNVYVTGVEEPTGNKSPGWLVAVKVTDPESSVAVGSTQVTETVVMDADGISRLTSWGQPVMTGLVVSTSSSGFDQYKECTMWGMRQDKTNNTSKNTKTQTYIS